VTHTLVIEDSHLTLIGFYTSLLHWEIRFHLHRLNFNTLYGI